MCVSQRTCSGIRVHADLATTQSQHSCSTQQPNIVWSPHLGLEEGVEVPEGGLHPAVGGHLHEAHVHQDAPELRPHLHVGGLSQDVSM